MSETTASPAWAKLPAIRTASHYCINCGTIPALFEPANVIAVGFGYAALHKDGVPVWSEDEAVGDDDLMTGQGAEALAAQDPDHDWRIVVHGALSSKSYQRHGPGEWALVEQDKGFA